MKTLAGGWRVAVQNGRALPSQVFPTTIDAMRAFFSSGGPCLSLDTANAREVRRRWQYAKRCYGVRLARVPRAIGALSLDLMDFAVIRRGTDLVVLDCETSVLGRLLRSPRLSWNEHLYARVADSGGVTKRVRVEFDPATCECSFGTSSWTLLTVLVDKYYDAFASVGVEALEDA